MVGVTSAAAFSENENTAPESVDQVSVDALSRAQSPAWTLLARALGFYVLATVGTSPLMASAVPSHIDSFLAGCRAPGCIRYAVDAACKACHHIRDTHESAILIAHEAFTGVTADIVAQAVEHPSENEENPVRVAKRRSLDWRRAGRTTVVSLVSDDLPFLLWSRYLWIGAEQCKASILQSTSLPRWLSKSLTSHVFMTLSKVFVTQLIYETTSDSAYLALQAGLRGGGWRGIMAELKAKLWTLRRDAIVYWSAAHIFVFSMPVWWLQPIADNSLTLIFNVYQSLLAHKELAKSTESTIIRS